MFSTFITRTFRFSQWTVKQGKYLIPSKPTNIPTPWALYVKQKLSNHPGSTKSKLKQLGQQYKKLSESQKAKYIVSQIKKQKHAQQKEKYANLYIKPFTVATYAQLVVAKANKNTKNIKEGSESIKKAFSSITPAQKQSYQKQAETINAERQKIIEKYMIPIDKYNGRVANFIHKTLNKNMKDLNKDEIKDQTKKYKQYLKIQKAEFEQFAKKHNLASGKLQSLINLEERKKQRAAKKRSKSTETKLNEKKQASKAQ